MKISYKYFIVFGWSALLLGLLLTACQVSSQEDSPRTVTQTESSPETVVQTESPETVVQTLYRNFSSGNESVVDQDRAVLSNYFAPELVDLILQDRACAEQSQGICNLDFDILHNTQDPQISDLEIDAFDSAQQTVTATFNNSGRAESVIYAMENTPNGWRIADIKYSGGESLKSILSQQ